MVDKVITGNCLILLTLSMRDDIENQSAMRHARTADPEGKRTIGELHSIYLDHSSFELT